MHLESRKDCIDAQDDQNLQRGDTLDAGRFFRNLKKDEVSRIYSHAPEFGVRLKTAKVRNWDDVKLGRGFSVNLVDCVRSPACSILIASDAERIYHVWELDLQKLNGYVSLADDRFTAVYEPIMDNHCHFELWTLNGTLNSRQILTLLQDLERAIPPEELDPPKGKKPPSGSEAAAEEAATLYHDVVTIHHDPLGKLSPGH